MANITSNSPYNSSKLYRFTELVDTIDSKSVTGNSVGFQVPSPAPTFFNSDEYNPLEWAQIMVKAKTIYGEPTTLSKEYEAIVSDKATC